MKYRLFLLLVLLSSGCNDTGDSNEAPMTATDSGRSVIQDATLVDDEPTSDSSIDSTEMNDAASNDDEDVETIPDAAVMEDMSVALPEVDCDYTFEWVSPAVSSFGLVGEELVIEALVRNADETPAEGLMVSIRDQYGRPIAEATTDGDGIFRVNSDSFFTERGEIQLLAQVQTDEGICRGAAERTIYQCSQKVDEGFTMLPMDWNLVRDATWDSGGWLEMTGNETNRSGVVYNDLQVISGGFASIQFSIATGGGSGDINDGSGADGFAFTIVELGTTERLLEYINAANAGGGLGYAVSGGHQDADYTFEQSAVTVEIDTFYNPPENRRHQDPTQDNHIAITLNGDPGNHLVWHAVPDIEDLEWHTIRVDLLSGYMRVWFDGEPVIEQEVNLNFKGGYMFFSGATGAATNFHRFDNLSVFHDCR